MIISITPFIIELARKPIKQIEKGNMNYKIDQTPLTEEIRLKILQGFGKHAIQTIGMNGFTGEQIAFEVYDKEKFAGVASVIVFWGQLHIKSLFVEEEYRHQGIGSMLIAHVLEFSQKEGCTIAFIETMSFQALEFYQKFGFILEFTRSGYTGGVGLHYLRKEL